MRAISMKVFPVDRAKESSMHPFSSLNRNRNLIIVRGSALSKFIGGDRCISGFCHPHPAASGQEDELESIDLLGTLSQSFH